MQILDKPNNNAIVSGSPPPTQSTVVGKQQQLAMAYQTGTGTGSYTASKWQWTIPDDPVASYNAMQGEAPVPLSSPQATASTSPFYWTWPGWWDPYETQTINAQMTLTRSDGQEIGDVSSSAVYNVYTPSSISMGYSTNEVQVGKYFADSTVPWLSLGTQTNPPSSGGIIWDLSAAAPPVGAGNFALVQLINRTISPPFNGTNGIAELDGCQIYSPAIHAGENSTATLQPGPPLASTDYYDAPAVNLGDASTNPSYPSVSI